MPEYTENTYVTEVLLRGSSDGRIVGAHVQSISESWRDRGTPNERRLPDELLPLIAAEILPENYDPKVHSRPFPVDWTAIAAALHPDDRAALKAAIDAAAA